MHRQMVKALVQRNIFCPVTGEVLDMDTCTVILDSDGDPAMVFAPSVGPRLAEIPNGLKPGFTIMER